jgi:integrase/recombinase XerD
MEKLLRKMLDEMRLRNYSPKTIESYMHCVREYFKYRKRNLQRANPDNMKSFLLNKLDNGFAPQTINLYLNAIKFFYREIVNSSKYINIRFAKTNKRLPVVLTKSEIHKIIENIKNPKHKLLISIAYGSGLRVSDVVNLKVEDIDISQMRIHIKRSKGLKDRITMLPDSIKSEIEVIVLSKNKKDYVFESNRNKKMAVRTAQKVFENAIARIALNKPATFHSLRHSFATHLIEDGINIRYIQELLGHSDIRTTQIYTRVANANILKIKSPL